MGAGDKPVLKVYGKRKSGDGPEYVDVAAFWNSDRGGLSGKWDKRIVAVKLEDGTIIKLADYYCNARDNSAGQPTTRREAPPKKPAADDPPPDFGDDDIPF